MCGRTAYGIVRSCDRVDYNNLIAEIFGVEYRTVERIGCHLKKSLSLLIRSNIGKNRLKHVNWPMNMMSHHTKNYEPFHLK